MKTIYSQSQMLPRNFFVVNSPLFSKFTTFGSIRIPKRGYPTDENKMGLGTLSKWQLFSPLFSLLSSSDLSVDNLNEHDVLFT